MMVSYYSLYEIPEVVRLYGLPQEWNKDGRFGPERYIEVQVWDDEPIEKYLRRQMRSILRR